MNLKRLVDIASFEPERVEPPNSWCGHLHFAAWIVQSLNPKVFVELGTHSGNSYLAFCQAVKEFGLETKCYAVDTWQGDEQAGFYNEEIFSSLNYYHQNHYSDFSRLLRMTFDEALPFFDDKNIDLLHIDGLHTYEAVKHDFEAWLPKLAQGAIVLFHDTNVYKLGFGVWKFWSELKERYPTNLDFFHSYGLGVLQIDHGDNLNQNNWLESSSTIKELLRRYFSSLGNYQIKSYELEDLRKQEEQLKRHIISLNQAIADRDGQIASLNHVVSDRDGQIASLNHVLSDREGQIASLNQVVSDREGQIASFNHVVSYHNGQIASLNHVVSDREGQIAILDSAAADRDGQIETLKRTLTESDSELALINFYLRRIQAPIRIGKRFMENILHPLRAYRLSRDMRTVKTSQLFDIGYYISKYRDVRISACDPIRHYCKTGWKEGRNPSLLFDTKHYLMSNSDVEKLGINPFVHYIKYGIVEGREINKTIIDQPSPVPSEEEILIQNTSPSANEEESPIENIPPSINEETTIDKNSILVMDYRIPRPDISAGEQATVGILSDLCEFGFNVVFLPIDMLSSPDYEEKLKSLGVTVVTQSQGYDSASDYLTKYGKYFPYFYLIRFDVSEQVIDTIRQVAPQSRIIFHAPDVYFIRESREAELRQAPSLQAKAEEVMHRELAIIGRVDHTVIVSPAELTILRQYLPNAPISVFKVLYASTNPNPAPYKSRRDIFFLGGFSHSPNLDAVFWFVNDIWPIIHKKLPDVFFHIIGSEAPKEILDLETMPGIFVDGYVKNLESILSFMRIGIAPLRFGAGIKGKLATTMGAGIPVVCTGIAAEGMSIIDGVNARVIDDNIAFAEAVVQTYVDQDQWERLSSNGRELVRRHFSKESNKSSFLSVLNEAEALPIELFIAFCNSSPPIQMIYPAEGESVDISVIIPVFNQWPYTLACLNSIAATSWGGDIQYEIILADDGSTDETRHAVKHFPGLRVVTTPQNLGFLRNCNNAATYARGKHILFLNNDTVVLPGWMSALYQLAESDDSAAIIGSKLLYPDETIQEAGAILWNDGTASNCGRYLLRNSPWYAYVREVDYVSGASFLVRKSFWESVGGFDERYENAYCEDADLAMTAHAKGMRVLYQPKSEVIHFEHKSYNGERSDYLLPVQRENIQRLCDKWKDEFTNTHLSPGTSEYRGIANAERSASQETYARRCQGSLNILYFSPFPSHPSNHGNQATIQQFGQHFQTMGHRVHFALLQSHLISEDAVKNMHDCWDTLDILPNSHPLGANGEVIPFDGWYEDGLGERIRHLCAKYDIDVVFCSYVFQSKLLEFVPSHMLKVIDTHDKMGDRYKMLTANGQPLEFFSCSPEEEGAYLRRADIVVARREEEARYFDNMTGRASAIVIPHVEAPHFVDKKFTVLDNVGIVASANRINLAMVRECLEAINRRLIQGMACPFTIHVAGQVKDMVDELSPLDAEIFHKPWVLMHGFVTDIAQFYGDMDMVVSPVTMGTGINVKTVQAMAFGMPLLTTAWGIKGIESNDPLHLHPDLNALTDSLFFLKGRPEELQRLAEVSRTRYASFYEDSLATMRGMFAHPKIWRKYACSAPRFNPMYITHSTYTISQDTRKLRHLIESELESSSPFTNGRSYEKALNGYCYICGPVKLSFSNKYGWKDESTGKDVINWRENLVCPHCGLNNRMRAIVHILGEYSSINKTAPVYITEQTTKLFTFLRSSLFPSLIGSEFIGNTCPLGDIHKGILNEDLTCLTFADNSLAGVFSFDVLEHIPDFRKALSEVYRCLASEGEFVFSVPFNPSSEKTLIRAEMDAEGNIKHILQPEYHGDPLDEKGVLCFQTFGWDLLDVLQQIGFYDINALDYWSKEYGYLGESLIFVARKSSKEIIDRQNRPLKRDDPGLRNYLIQTLERYYLEGQHSDDVLISANNLIRMDGQEASSWLPEVLSRNQMHDEDFSIFRAFNSPQMLIIDAGANWGYSAASIWTTCPQVNIVAFEPILSYEKGLQKIKELRPDNYDFRMIGLANETTSLKFAVPVVNGIAISSLSSASFLASKAHIAILARNIHDSIIHWMPDENPISLRIFEFNSPVRKLDDVLQEENFLFGKKLAAIKIDVEGYEFEVLKGAEATLLAFKPLLMTEGGNRFDGLPDFMANLGYLYAENKGGALVLIEGIGTSINGFFVHKDNLSEYQSSGILILN